RRVLLNIGRGLVVGGAGSNLADRMRLGAVVDYLVIRRGDIGIAINLADLAIIGQDDPDAAQPGATGLAGDVLFAAGRPVLVVPYAGHFA
ncbi:MAG: signal peptidase II, partial [Elioraea tepidiphila]